MKRILRDAVLVAVTAAAVWVIRGDAQQAEPMGYGQAFQLQCQTGTITSVTINEAPRGYNLAWASSPMRQFDGNANLTECVAYPDLRTPTP